jgi:hypothetical protein
MRIHRIRLRNYRGVDEHEVVFPPTGVTVVQGDNEVGKSSLAEALDLLFDAQDSSTSKAVKAVKPVHKDVATEVEADIEAGPYRFTYLKRFHKDRATVLRITEPTPKSLTGREAHEHVLAILDEVVDRPLWNALRLQQGVGPDQADLSEQTSLAAALDAASAGALAGDREATLVDRARTEYERFFTPKGSLKAEVERLAGLEDEAERRVADLKRRLADLDQDVEHHAAVAAAIDNLARGIDEQRLRVADYEGQWGAVQGVLQRLEAARVAAERAALAEQRAADEVTRRQALADQLDQAERRLQDRLAEQRRHQPDLDAAGAALAQAEAAAAGTAEQARQADQRARQCQSDLTFAQDSLMLATMAERAERVAEAQARLLALDALFEANRVDQVALEAIEDANLGVVQAQARIEADRAVVEVEALQAVEIELDGAARSLAAGETVATTAPTAETAIRVGNLARVVVRAGREAGRSADALAEAEEQLARLCRAAGVDGLAGARAAAAARHDALRQREHLAARLADDLRDLTPERLTAKIERLEAHLAEARAARQAARQADAADQVEEPELDLGTARRLAEEADRAAAAAHEALRQAEADLSVARAQLDAARQQAAASEREAALARLQAETAGQALETARLEIADNALADALEAAADARRRADADLHAAQGAADQARPEEIRATLENAAGVLDKLQRERQDAERDLVRLKERLAVLGEEGLNDRLGEAEAELEQRGRERRATERRAAAARRLFETLMRCRAEARHAYLAPLKERIDRLGAIVFGPEFSVELRDDLRIARRTVGGVTVDFDQLSVGAREQLCVISRLACAAIVGGAEGVPVILDDALGWSDATRLERLGAVLSVAAKDAQVIVLTCLPERYRHVGSAHVVELR